MATRDNTLILSYLQHLEIDLGRTAGTINSYFLHLSRLADYLAMNGSTLLSASTEELQKFSGLSLHKKGISPRSRRPAIAAVRGFFQWAHRRGHIKKNAAATLYYPSTGKQLPNTLSLKDLEKIIMQTDLNEFLGVRDAAIIFVLAGCGLRVSGLVALNESDLISQLDKDGKETAFLRVTEKGNQERLAPLPPEVLLMVRAYLGHSYLETIDRSLPNGDRVLFVNTRHPGKKVFDNCGESRRLSSTGIRRLIAKYGRKAGIQKKYCHPHALRHLYGTELVEANTDLLTVQNLMGHSSAESTKIYVHLSTRRLREAVEKGNPLGKIKTPVTGLVQQLQK